MLATLDTTEINAEVDRASEKRLKAGRDLSRVASLKAKWLVSQE